MNFNGKIYKISNGTNLSLCDDEEANKELKLYIKSESVSQKRIVYDQLLRCITKRDNLDADLICAVGRGLVLVERDEELCLTEEGKILTRQESDE